jgi:hypothetical protein
MGAVMALMLGVMLVIIKYAIHLPLRSIAAAHLYPLLVTAAASGLCLTLKALLPGLPGPTLVLLALALLLSSACVFAFFNQERVFGSSGVLAFNRPHIGGR